MQGLNRRRFIAIAAAAGAAAAAPARAAADVHVWNGTALGARASLRLHHPDRAEAERLIDACVVGIARLERIFSLYRPDSALRRLNAAGELAAPPLDLVRILQESRQLSRETGGAFDVTVQPLWQLYAEHFAAPDADPTGPPADAIAEARSRVGSDALTVAADRLGFEQPGMAVTLNGIAQGYVTDRVAELLQNAGLKRVLVDLGEARAIGRHPDGRSWRAALADPKGHAFHRVDLEDRALATSAPSGFVFRNNGRSHHLFDPRTGRPHALYASVSVLAPDATSADGLSTAFVQMPEPAISRTLVARRGAGVHLLHHDGRHQQLHSPAA
jgi:thiamine biosynthesis lipoprotein